jgi:ribosomal RNA assembly protein
MEKIYSEKLPRILKHKKKLEKSLGIKISNRGKEVFVEGAPIKEYFATLVIDALNFGFSLERALLLKNEEFVFEILNIKDYTRKRNMERIRGRIIGKDGRTLKTLENLTSCFFELNDNRMGIIGNIEKIENAQTAVISLVRGSKQSNVYNYLEKHQIKKIYDLGLKEEFLE